MKKTIFALLIALFALIPGLVLAQEETAEPEDLARAPRLGLELACSYGGFASWQRGYENGGLILCSAGVGVLEAHGGAMFRISGGNVGGFFSRAGDPLENILNAEALLWLPHQVGENHDIFLAVGPMIQWIGNARRADSYVGAVVEAGFDWLLSLNFVRMRYSLRSHLTYTNADIVFAIGTTFWSFPI